MTETRGLLPALRRLARRWWFWQAVFLVLGLAVFWTGLDMLLGRVPTVCFAPFALATLAGALCAARCAWGLLRRVLFRQ
ncbi:hypothetical protein JW921_08380 [Candidatus Fermentibacterales bacterium]|nr:hypothetical protein [Candidatus Fermentibacterales bacterium]